MVGGALMMDDDDDDEDNEEPKAQLNSSLNVISVLTVFTCVVLV